jgi:methionyl-tRNA synthetase
MDKFHLHEAIDIAMGIVRKIDLFINETSPFKLAKDEAKKDELGTILYQCIEALRIASTLLHPAIPAKMDEFHQAIGVELPSGDIRPTLEWGGMKAGTPVKKIALFPRVESVAT